MKTSWVMTASASLLIAHGLALLFASELLLGLLSISRGSEGPAAAQLLGAALMSIGLMNWTARGLVVGGIYARSLVYGNFAYSFIGFLVSLRARLGGFSNDYFWIEVVLHLAFAIVFGLLLFKGPMTKAKTT